VLETAGHSGKRYPNLLYWTCIKRRADALANLPNPGKVVSRKGDAANSATKRIARMSALLGKPKEGFLCRTGSSIRTATAWLPSRPQLWPLSVGSIGSRRCRLLTDCVL
jgi:hypothetical protein